MCKIDIEDQVCLSSFLQFVLMEKDFAYQYTNTDKYEKGIYISSPHICVLNKRNSYWIHLFVILLLDCIYMKQTLFTSFLHNKQLVLRSPSASELHWISRIKISFCNIINCYLFCQINTVLGFNCKDSVYFIFIIEINTYHDSLSIRMVS